MSGYREVFRSSVAAVGLHLFMQSRFDMSSFCVTLCMCACVRFCVARDALWFLSCCANGHIRESTSFLYSPHTSPKSSSHLHLHTRTLTDRPCDGMIVIPPLTAARIGTNAKMKRISTGHSVGET